MTAKQRNSGIYLIAWKKTTRRDRTSVGLINALDDIVNKMPKKYEAKIDHRIKRNTWIWVKPEHQKEARNYIIENLGIACVSVEISEKWYIHK